MALLPLPNPDALQDKDKWVSTTFYRFLSSIENRLRKTDRILRFIDTATNATYSIELSAPYGYTITKTLAKCISGTCTLTLKINGTAIDGGDHSVSSTLSQIDRTSANTVNVENTVTATIASNSSCIGLVISLEYIRT